MKTVKKKLVCPNCGGQTTLTRIEKRPKHWCRKCGHQWDGEPGDAEG